MPDIRYIIGIDYESYYDKDYSLSKMPTHQYVRDARFKCLGCGFEFPGEAPFYAKDHDATEQVLKRIDKIGWEHVALVAHNAYFDGTVLYERFSGRKPGLWLDTQLMARYLISQGKLSPEQMVSLGKLAHLVGMRKGDTWAAVHGTEEERADYGLEDIRIMMALLRKFMAHGIPGDELAYMDMKVRAGTEPQLHFDPAVLAEAAKISPADAALHKLLRKDANMVKLLEAFGVEVEYKEMAPTKTKPNGYFKPALSKTDTFMQGLLEDPDGVVQELASRRLEANSSITRTRAQTMLDVGMPMPMPYLYYGAHTGRDSGKDNLNVQNFPNKGPLRSAIIAPPGHLLVVGDSSQIEARYVGWRAGDERLLEVFREADKDATGLRDAYRLFGGQYMYRKPPEELLDDERKLAKAAVLGLGFGQGWRGLKASSRRSGLVITEDMSRLGVNAYRNGFPMVPKWWYRLMRWALEDGYVELPDGRRMIYPDIGEELFNEGTDEEELEKVFYRPAIFSKRVRYGERQRVKLWHGLVTENDTQAGARSVVFWQALQMRKSGINLVGMSHDETIAIAPMAEAEEVGREMLRWLRTPPPFAQGLPLNGKVQIGRNYAECK